MRQKLIAYINELFRGAEATEQNAELKEQILASALSRYDIFVLEGGEEQAAYDAAAAEALERSAAIVRPGASSPAAPAAPWDFKVRVLAGSDIPFRRVLAGHHVQSVADAGDALFS